ncbi:MAG: hypothetical protein WBV61_03135 [Rhodanobacteraceae bacterium]
MSLSRIISLPLGVVALCALIAPAAAQAGDHTPTVIHSSRHDVSAPMRDIIRNMPPQQPLGTENEPFEIPNIFIKPHVAAGSQVQLKYPGIQKMPTGVPAPPVDLSFEGISQAMSGCGCLPPDTEGDVSENEYIQWVNTSWAVYDKTTGALTSGPTPGNSFWVGFGGKCETTNSGDPLTVYDQRAHRWVMSQFVTSAPYGQCVAVSQTSDPLGTYDRYEFDWPANHFGDYGKLGVWTDDSGTQDAYLLTTHEFVGNNFAGAAYIAMDRDAMLAGAPTANMVRVGGFNSYGVQPFNLIGTLNAPANACPSFVYDDSSTGNYLFWNMCLDWTTPPYGTVSAPESVQGQPFTDEFDNAPQLGSAQGIDTLGFRIMFHAQVRAFPPGAPTQMSLILSHTVAGDSGQAAESWLHFSMDDGGSPPPQPAGLHKQIVDEGVYSPDPEFRFVGAAAIDSDGNIGVGYSRSSADSHPQIMVTGRSFNDPAGTLRDEQNCTDGIANGSQTSSSNRWGDYSEMSVDPSDQCTFYYTDEYYPTTGGASWHTRVCSFKFPDCGNPDFALVSDTPRRIEMCGATASGDPTWTLRAGVLNGFTGDVTFTADGVPAGATAAFDPNPVSAPGQSVLTLINGAELPTGEYSFDANGTNASLTRSITLELGVSATAPDVPELTAPDDGATDTATRPTLVWGGGRIFGDGFDGVALPPLPPVGGALNYTVEVASDQAFTDIVASATVTTTSWTVTPALDSNTTYYWRVTPNNYCGDGASSVVFSFTTGDPAMCPAGTTGTVVYDDDFENGINGWTASGTGGTAWAQGPAPSGTGLTSTVWLIPDNGVTSDQTLVSPTITIPAGATSVIMSYDTYHSFETVDASSCYDNSSLAIASDGSSTFDYLGPERMITDPYDGVATDTPPLTGEQVWCEPPVRVPTQSVVNLSDFAGHDVQIEFHALSDPNSAAADPNGMVIDNFKVQACQ